ncbi:MAG TPA: beta-propeller fold lactonase family protein [Acidobacteriaceae bacterium]|jgi:6-phosphogluconolactonase|nr:beta-propeller fold lactonase family protein [Acidobacteriaceae bacterium]
MKLMRIGQGFLATAACLGIGLGITSCNPGDTIDYLFVTSNNSNTSTSGEVTSYHVNSYSGTLTAVGPAASTHGDDPVALVASPNQQNLYVANHATNTIAQFTVATNGELAFGHSYTTPGVEPVALAINGAGTLLFVLDYYQAGFSDATPGPGELMVYPINSDGTLGTPVGTAGSSFAALQCFPTGVAVTSDGKYAYVTNTNAVVVTTSPPTTANPPATPAGCPAGGTISGYSVASSGALTPMAGSPFLAGSTPTGIAIDPTNRYLYATDSVQNQLIAYQIISGVLYPLTNGPFSAGTFPVNVTVDPRGKYIYVTNYNVGTITEYSIQQSTGTPSLGASSSFSTKAPFPTCILVEPALGLFVYTSDFTSAYVTGAELNPNTGALNTVQDSPFPANGSPTCVAAIPHGNHATQFDPVTSGN